MIADLEPGHGDAGGTDAGYQRHLRRREQPCDACARAHRERSRSWPSERARPNRVSPAQDVDEVAVQRAVAGEPVWLNLAERREALRVLHSWGFRDREIAQRLGKSVDAVIQARKRLGLPVVTR